jgi:hypothetical protein
VVVSRILETRARRRVATEIGTIRKPHGSSLRVALAYPNRYYIGMSNVGFQAVYRFWNELEDVVCERVFLPDAEECGCSSSRGFLCSPGIAASRTLWW